MHTCATCGVVSDLERLPMGWKRLVNNVLCGTCKAARFAVRAPTLRIVSPIGLGWPDLRAMLRESFDASRQAANWVLRQIAASDPGIDPQTKKLGKLPQVRPDGESLYKGVAARWPDIDTRTASCIVQAATAKYRAARFDMHRGKVSLPTIRNMPIMVHVDTWSIAEGECGGLVLEFALGRKNRARVRLSGGVNYRRQLVDVRRLISGEAMRGQLDLIEDGSHVLAKLVGHYPIVARTGGWAAALHTGGDAFVTLYNDERRTIYRWNADHVRRRIAAQDEQMQRLREDLKAEKRIGRDRDGILARMEKLRDDHAHFMHTFCHEVTAQIIGHLARKRCGLLMVVAQDQSYMPHFPWHKFRTMLADKANRAGIEIASGDAATESPELLEQVTQQ